MFGFGKTYTHVFPRFSAVASLESLANTGFSGLRHLAASSAKIIQSGFVTPVLKTVRAKVHRGSNPLPSATSEQARTVPFPHGGENCTTLPCSSFQTRSALASSLFFLDGLVFRFQTAPTALGCGLGFWLVASFLQGTQKSRTKFVLKVIYGS